MNETFWIAFAAESEKIAKKKDKDRSLFHRIGKGAVIGGAIGAPASAWAWSHLVRNLSKRLMSKGLIAKRLPVGKAMAKGAWSGLKRGTTSGGVAGALLHPLLRRRKKKKR